MAYICLKPMLYNGRDYEAGQEIAEFGQGLHDDLLLDQGAVYCTGGTGAEDRIANLSKMREERRKQETLMRGG